jgi:hypothetical protein
VIVGFVAVVVANEARKQMRVASLGGDQFFAVSFLNEPGMDAKGKFPLLISSGGSA